MLIIKYQNDVNLKYFPNQNGRSPEIYRNFVMWATAEAISSAADHATCRGRGKYAPDE